VLRPIISSLASSRERKNSVNYKSFAPGAPAVDANSSQFEKIFYRGRKTSAALMRYGR
jgi:hypothetical protein